MVIKTVEHFHQHSFVCLHKNNRIQNKNGKYQIKLNFVVISCTNFAHHVSYTYDACCYE